MLIFVFNGKVYDISQWLKKEWFLQMGFFFPFFHFMSTCMHQEFRA